MRNSQTNSNSDPLWFMLAQIKDFCFTKQILPDIPNIETLIFVNFARYAQYRDAYFCKSYFILSQFSCHITVTEQVNEYQFSIIG